MELFFGFDLVSLIKAVGLAGLFAIVFAESGLLIGFFLPGDSLLFTAGFLASQGFANIWVIVGGCVAAAVLGDNFGYAFGRRVGPAIFRREHSFLFNPQNLERARQFYELYGGMAIIMARFLPAIRTFAPILAGVGAMNYPKFIVYNFLGAGLWALGMPILGFYLGSTIPGVDRYLVPIILAIITLSMLPSIFAVFSNRERRVWMVEQIRVKVRQYHLARKTAGIILIVIGLAAIFIPLFPFAWLALVGLNLLGLKLAFFHRPRRPEEGSSGSKNR